MKLFFLLSLSTGFAFLRYTLSIPSFLTPDANFTCNNLVKKFVSILYSIIRLLVCKQPYGDTVLQLMDRLTLRRDLERFRSFRLLWCILYCVVQLKYQHLVDCLYSIRDAPFLPQLVQGMGKIFFTPSAFVNLQVSFYL